MVEDSALFLDTHSISLYFLKLPQLSLVRKSDTLLTAHPSSIRALPLFLITWSHIPRSYLDSHFNLAT